MRQDCEAIIAVLESCAPYEWAKTYVRLYLKFWREHCLGLIFSTSHGIDFFRNILACLDGAKWSGEGEYEENFRKFIRHYQNKI